MLQGLAYDDVLLTPAYTGSASRANVDTTAVLKGSSKTTRYYFKTPIISANMDTVTGVKMANKMGELGGFGILHRFCSIEENLKMFQAIDSEKTVGVSIGVSDSEKERLDVLIEAGARIICVDVAHAHSKLAGAMIKHIKLQYHGWDVFVIAGNVATYAGADHLSGHGADAIKVGVGPGSACSTRIKTGCGVPQLTAIMECSRAKCSIIADGGIRKPADFVKALAAGADMIMVGGMLAGTDETPGDYTQTKGGFTKTYRGSASKEAQEDFLGQVGDWKTSEGVSFEVPCKGPVEDVIKDLMGGLRSGMTYCGATNLDELRARAQFIQVTPNGFIEGTPHGQGRL